MRGKDPCLARICLPAAGSPPLARERRQLCRRYRAALGITPACAGKTSCPPATIPKGRDHPRLRGKDVTLRDALPVSVGSPPLARERLTGCRGLFCRLGITPACAGKTMLGIYFSSFSEDHPRLRGKDLNKTLIHSSKSGSPPLARERPDYLACYSVYRGITPACAGKTSTTFQRSDFVRDHPRLRGKDLAMVQHHGLYRRITPACAGKTS